MAKEKEPRSRKMGRDDDTGRFKSVEEARRDKSGSSVEHVPLPGYGTEHRKRQK